MSNSEKYLKSKSRQSKKAWGKKNSVKGLIVNIKSAKYRASVKQ